MEWQIKLHKYLGPQRLDRSRRLTEAAIECFVEQGIMSTDVTDISARAELSRTQFYYAFEDKTGCYTSARNMAFDEVLLRLTRATNRAQGWQEQIQNAVGILILLAQENLPVLKFALVDGQIASDKIDMRLQKRAHKKVLRALTDIYREAAPKEADISGMLAEMSFGSARQILASRLGDQPFDPRRTTSEMVMSLTVIPIGLEAAKRMSSSAGDNPAVTHAAD